MIIEGLVVTNTSSLPGAHLQRVGRALAHWSPYRRVVVNVVPAPYLYAGIAFLEERRIIIRLGSAEQLPYLDNQTPTVPWGYIRSLTQACVGLLAHELWHLRQYRTLVRQGRGWHSLPRQDRERPADEAAAHAIRQWKAGKRHISLWRAE